MFKVRRQTTGAFFFAEVPNRIVMCVEAVQRVGEAGTKCGLHVFVGNHKQNVHVCEQVGSK